MTAAGHAPIGTAEWEAQRRAAWIEKARALAAELERYEDEHPSDAPCFMDFLSLMTRRIATYDAD